MRSHLMRIGNHKIGRLSILEASKKDGPQNDFSFIDQGYVEWFQGSASALWKMYKRYVRFSKLLIIEMFKMLLFEHLIYNLYSFLSCNSISINFLNILRNRRLDFARILITFKTSQKLKSPKFRRKMFWKFISKLGCVL